MPYAGKTLVVREGAELCYQQGWRYHNLVKMLATLVGESKLSVGAWHDNQALITDCSVNEVVCNIETLEPTTVLDPAQGKVRLSGGDVVSVPLTTTWIRSRDCGLGQINIPARLVGTAEERALRTESLDVVEYWRVSRNNIERCWKLWQARKFQPWMAYTTGWATFPAWWVWHQDEDGNPVGPWVPTGRYAHQAIRGIANYHLIIARDYTAEMSLTLAEERAAQFKIPPAPGQRQRFKIGSYHDKDIGLTKPIINWNMLPPPKPTEPPADGLGPRPVPNDGS